MSSCYNSELALVHIPKTGGISATEYLKETCPSIQELPFRHVPLFHFTQYGQYPTAFKKVVAIIRNPLEQRISQYSFWRQEADRGKTSEEFMRAKNQTFEEFIKDRSNLYGCPPDYTQGYYHFWLQVKGKIPANVEVIKLEEIDQLEQAVKPFQVLRSELKTLNKSQHEDSIYTDELKAIVREQFSWTYKEGYYE